MSQENIELVRRAVELFNESGIDNPAFESLVAEDVEFHEPPEQPAPRVARGLDEVRRLFGEFDSAWAEHRTEPEGFQLVGESEVLMTSIERFKGRDGIELSAPVVNVYTVRDGKITCWRAFWDRDAALKAYGVSE